MGKDEVDQMIDRIVGLLGQQKLRIEELTTISGNAREEIVGILEDLGPKK